MATPRRNGGYTLIELMIALGLLAVVAVKITLVLRSAARMSSEDTSEVVLEDQARLALDRIAYAIMGSSRGTLTPDEESPLSSGSVRYRISLGVDADGEVVWSDPEEIAVEGAGNRLVWKQNPDAAEERRVVWSNLVTPFMEGELQNGVDDNGNGLIDEKGLSFVVERDNVTIRLSLGRTVGEQSITVPVETRVTCRN